MLAALQRNAAVPKDFTHVVPKDFTRIVPKPIVVVVHVNGHPARALLRLWFAWGFYVYYRWLIS
jgi:hypothetical protein